MGNDNIIEARDLSKKFGDFQAVDSVSFAVKRGEIFGFLGPNGAGKTTTINMLTTLLDSSGLKFDTLPSWMPESPKFPTFVVSKMQRF